MQWNPWHGCRKYSEGCANCYVYRIDERHGRDPSEVFRTKEFDLPLRKNRSNEYKIKSGELVYTCFSSDFFLDVADEWRNEAWSMMKQRSDVSFLFITKRIERFYDVIPDDWGDGYENVAICSTVESEKQAKIRLPIYCNAPIKHKYIICEPLLTGISLEQYLDCPNLEGVVVGGESGPNARVCDYSWVLDIRRQCVEHDVPFSFKQTGASFRKDGRVYSVERKHQHTQAKKAGIDYRNGGTGLDGFVE